MTITQAPEVIWMRIGFEDGYHAVVTVEDAADHLAEFYGIENVARHNEYGVSTDGFQGQNYISLYWGTDPKDGNAEMTRPLTDDEITEVNLSLESIRDCVEANHEDREG
jgi:hypothetical protein